MREIVTYFSGGGFAEIAAREAGLTPVCGVEIDDAIADVYERNHGRHIIRKPVQMIDPTQVPAAYWFHASPVCTRASNANTGAEECELDLEMARAVVAYITTHKPPCVSIENVWMYRTFESFEVIRRALVDEGYSVDWWHLNSADFGTPQTRKRLFMVGSREKRVKRPMPTHHDASDGQAGLFTAPWNGWLWAIEDLIDSLPVSAFAKWQLARLPTELATFLIMSGNNNFEDARAGKVPLFPLQPAATVTAGLTGGMPKAFLMRGDNARRRQGEKEYKLPSEPVMTISGGGLPRAWIVEGSAAGGDNKFNLPVRSESQPVFTMRALQNNPRAFIVDGKLNNRSESVTSREGEARGFTLTTSHNMRDVRAWLPLGRTVKMTPRAIYRFQASKGRDWYQLPDSASLAGKIIGNGVAVDCLKAVIEANL